MARFNEHFFDKIDNELKAYWLGFIWADGSITCNNGTYSFAIHLQDRDHYHLDILDRDLSYEGSRNGGKYSWFSKYMIGRIMHLGLVPDKSHNEVSIPRMPKRLIHHFWRGVFDGDGMITTRSKKCLDDFRFSICGTHTTVTSFSEWMLKFGIKKQKIAKAKNQYGETHAWKFEVGGNRQVAALMSQLYHRSTRYLLRKYKIACELHTINGEISPSFKRKYIDKPFKIR